MRQKGRSFALAVIAEGVKTATGEKHKFIADPQGRMVQVAMALGIYLGIQPIWPI